MAWFSKSTVTEKGKYGYNVWRESLKQHSYFVIEVTYEFQLWMHIDQLCYLNYGGFVRACLRKSQLVRIRSAAPR